ncbi:MAG: hypothetical protein ABW182_02970, partial [Sphingomonas sp.]
MRFESSVSPYIEGSEFDTSLKAKVTGANTRAASRIDYLDEISMGKQVLHIGFTDHQESIEAKRPTGQWLHGRLMASATRVLGVDINEKTVRWCESELGIGDIHVHNVIDDAPLAAITETHWDIAILGEILEHVPNPVAFLQALRKKYGANIKRLVVTVPNATYLENFTMARRNIELINTDHRY